MDPSWIEPLGRVSLYLFYTLLGALLIGVVVRRALRRAASGDWASVRIRKAPEGPGGRLERFLVEYLGNVDVAGGGAAIVDRRQNRQARILMDHIRRDMLARTASQADADRLMEELRETLRAEGQEHPG